MRHRVRPVKPRPQIGDSGSDPDVCSTGQGDHRTTRSAMRPRLSAKLVANGARVAYRPWSKR